MANCDCLNDSGFKDGEKLRADAVTYATTLRVATAVAQIVLAGNEYYSIYRAKKKIASEQLELAEEQHAHVKEVYWPRELQFLAEFTKPEDAETAEVLGSRYAGRLVSTVARQFADRIRDFKCSAPRYCSSAFTKGLQDLLMARANAIANARVMGRLIAYAEVQAREERDWDRRMQAVSIGKGLIEQAANLYGQAAAIMASAGQDVASRLNSGLANLGMAVQGRDPGPSAQMQAMWASRQQQGFQFQPGGGAGNMGMGIGNTTGMMSLSGVTDSMSETGYESMGSGIGPGFDAHGNAIRSWYHPPETDMREDASMAFGKVDRQDRVRVGEFTYPVKGGKGTVTVRMEDFAVDLRQNLQPGDKE